eukprot:XP_001703363.1 predicted protein [Chlamydomonas reinhardtii]
MLEQLSGLDYDQLIALAGRVDASSVVARAFERARDGLIPQVDEQLLALLERRYAAGVRMGQEGPVLERIAGVFRALRYAWERRSSSAAERLLDDVLALAGEQVVLEEFKQETLGILNKAQNMQNNTASSVAAILEECERLRATDPAQLDSKEWRDRLEQVRLARQALSQREASISALQEVVLLTRAIEMELLTGRMRGA